jgi:large subunit ribosomal protein L27
MSTHKAAGGKASQHISPAGKRLGPKVADGEGIKPGMILVKQNGTKIKPGTGVRMGRDYTIFAVIDGIVKFSKKLGKNYISVIAKK